MEPGLGESEFFYSALMAIFNGTASITAFLVGILVRCVPYWYQYLLFTAAKVAEIKDVPLDELARRTTINAENNKSARKNSLM